MPLTPRTTKLLIGGAVTLLTIGGFAIWYFFIRCNNKDNLTMYLALMQIGCVDRQALTMWGGMNPCPGSQVMNGFHPVGTNHQKILAVSNRLHNTAQAFWTWNGQFNGEQIAFGAMVLDGEETYPPLHLHIGECAIIVNALWLLVTAKQPYGLQLGPGIATDFGDHGPFDRVEYSGAHDKGFISQHNGAPFNLTANVFNPAGARQNRYFWSNHKVLSYDHQDGTLNGGQPVYYDPNYANTQGGPGFYNALADMTVGQVSDDLHYHAPDPSPYGNKIVDGFIAVETPANVNTANRDIYVICRRRDNNAGVATTVDVNAMPDPIQDKLHIRTIAIGPLSNLIAPDLANINHAQLNIVLNAINLNP